MRFLGSRFPYEIIWNVWKWNRIELAYVCTWYYILNKTIKTSGKESGKEKKKKLLEDLRERERERERAKNV